MHLKKIILVSLAAGLLAGVASNTLFLRGTWLNIPFWGIIGVVIGGFTQNKQERIWSGIWFGVALGLAFMVSAFGGTPDKIPAYAVLTIIVCVAGALGGLVSVFIGSWIVSLTSRRNIVRE